MFIDRCSIIIYNNMKIEVVKVNIKTGEKIICQYPREDKDTVASDTTYEYYFTERAEKPEYDNKLQTLEEDSLNNGRIQLIKEERRALIGWKIIDIPIQEIIDALTYSMGQHLDTYIVELRIKHLAEAMEIALLGDLASKEQMERFEYLKSLRDWMHECREIRDKRESEFVVNKTYPSHTWPKKPTQI